MKKKTKLKFEKGIRKINLPIHGSWELDNEFSKELKKMADFYEFPKHSTVGLKIEIGKGKYPYFIKIIYLEK